MVDPKMRVMPKVKLNRRAQAHFDKAKDCWDEAQAHFERAEAYWGGKENVPADKRWEQFWQWVWWDRCEKVLEELELQQAKPAARKRR